MGLIRERKAFFQRITPFPFHVGKGEWCSLGAQGCHEEASESCCPAASVYEPINCRDWPPQLPAQIKTEAAVPWRKAQLD